MGTCQKQVRLYDCGLFSIANATAIVNGIEPTLLTYKQEDMRLHFIQCNAYSVSMQSVANNTAKPCVRKDSVV